MRTLATTQPQEPVRQNAELQIRRKLVFDELRYVRPGVRLDLGKESLQLFLHYGVASFNLPSAQSTAGVFLYIGEVGSNGEVAASSISISDTRVAIPEPASFALLGLGLAGLALSGRKRT